MMVGFKAVLAHSPRLSQTKMYQLEETVMILPCPLYIQEQENSLVTIMAGDETQCTERNGFYSSKLNQFSQIPRYIFNHHIYIKY